jgi:hypothetical protein
VSQTFIPITNFIQANAKANIKAKATATVKNSSTKNT